MKIFDLLKIDPKETKVHLAAHNGIVNPLDVYLDEESKFKKWQEHQNRKNFERRYILSLIQMPGNSLWLFVGIYKSNSVQKSKDQKSFYYTTELTDIAEDLRGRLIIKHVRSGRNSYRNGDGLVDSAHLYEIKSDRVMFSIFKSYKEIFLTRGKLEILFRHSYPSWKGALSTIKGVYLISDSSSGKLYVGSAYGENGIWQRWEEYSKNYHGGNTEFKELFKTKKKGAFSSFAYSILETFTMDSSKKDIIEAEERWKKKLLTVDFGFNQTGGKKSSDNLDDSF